MILNVNSIRRGLLVVHLWLGLTAGLLLALTGLSGSALVFGDEWDRLLNPELRHVAVGETRVPVSRLLDTALATEKKTPRQLRFSARPDAPVEVWFNVHGGRRLHLNPYTGEILGARDWSQSALGILTHLHVELLAGDNGETVVGWLGVGLLLLALTGLGLWWPRAGKWSTAVSIRRPYKSFRTSFDVHRVTGVLPLPLLLLAGLTGAAMVFPKPFESVLTELTGQRVRTPVPQITPGETPLPLDTLLETAERALPGAFTARVELPAQPTAPLRIRKRFDDEVHPNGTSYVTLNPYTGEVISAERASQAGVGTRLFAWRYPAHIGSWGGWMTRLLAFFAGLALPTLFVTGLTLNRIRARACVEGRVVPAANADLS